ncbi:MAG: Tet(A)/Tet(B)/Tet(C) family tetracycline efflux MFS transporter [Rhodospirillales bacterium]
MNKPLVVILAAVTLDAVGIGLVFPILPALLRELTGSGEVAGVYGMLLSLYALMQFLCAPVLGLLSDRYGRRPVLLLSLAGAAVDYVVLALAPSLWLVLAGRAVAGITAANLAVATAYLADISPEAVRARRFGYLHACFGIGFILGPVIGGVLGDIWVRYPFVAAAVLNALNFALALLVLPESRPGVRRPLRLGALNPFASLRWAMTFAALLPLLAVFVTLNFVGQVYGTVWVLYGEDRFGWTAMTVGLSLAGYGLAHAGAQAFLTGPATARLGERPAVAAGVAFEVLALVALAFATRGWIVFALLPVFALGGIGLPALQSLLSREVGADRQGELQGVLASLVSLTAIVGPLAFSTLYSATRDWWSGAIWLFGAAVYLAAAPMLAALRRRSRGDESKRGSKSND